MTARTVLFAYSRSWTRNEELRAARLRLAGYRSTDIARLLGRTEAAVSVKLSRIGMRLGPYRPHRRPRGGFLAAVAAACRPGRSDREVATVLGTTRQEVFKARKKLGIAAGLSVVDAARLGGRLRWVSWVHCFNCRAKYKQGSQPPGWMSCVIIGVPGKASFCAKCVRRYGTARLFAGCRNPIMIPMPEEK